MATKTISTSKDGKMKQVVEHTIQEGTKNRKGKPCIISKTRHVSTSAGERYDAKKKKQQ